LGPTNPVNTSPTWVKIEALNQKIKSITGGIQSAEELKEPIDPKT
jgi:hypothetical protein